jgi:hypothetical protein
MRTEARDRQFSARPRRASSRARIVARTNAIRPSSRSAAAAPRPPSRSGSRAAAGAHPRLVADAERRQRGREPRHVRLESARPSLAGPLRLLGPHPPSCLRRQRSPDRGIRSATVEKVRLQQPVRLLRKKRSWKAYWRACRSLRVMLSRSCVIDVSAATSCASGERKRSEPSVMLMTWRESSFAESG